MIYLYGVLSNINKFEIWVLNVCFLKNLWSRILCNPVLQWYNFLLQTCILNNFIVKSNKMLSFSPAGRYISLLVKNNYFPDKLKNSKGIFNGTRLLSPSSRPPQRLFSPKGQKFLMRKKFKLKTPKIRFNETASRAFGTRKRTV